jgi:hypothetical protein
VLVEILQINAKTKVLGLPPQKYLDAVLDHLLEEAQKNTSLDGTAGLEAEEIIREHEMFLPFKLKVLAGRGKKFLRVAYDADFLPLLPHIHPPSWMLLEEAHRSTTGELMPYRHGFSSPIILSAWPLKCCAPVGTKCHSAPQVPPLPGVPETNHTAISAWQLPPVASLHSKPRCPHVFVI